MNWKSLSTLAVLAFLAGAAAMYGSARMVQDSKLAEASEPQESEPEPSLMGLKEPASTGIDSAQGRSIVMPDDVAESSVAESSTDPAQSKAKVARPKSEPPRGRLFQEMSFYENSPEFNPGGRILLPAEREKLAIELLSLESRAVRAQARLDIDIERAVQAKLASGNTRAGDIGNVSVAPGAIATHIGVTRDGVFAADVYPQDVPSAELVLAEFEAMREQGLALIRDYYQRY